jgi:hypothetical protein
MNIYIIYKNYIKGPSHNVIPFKFQINKRARDIFKVKKYYHG